MKMRLNLAAGLDEKLAPPGLRSKTGHS